MSKYFDPDESSSRRTCKIAILVFFTGLLFHFSYLILLLNFNSLDQLNWMTGDTSSYLTPAQAFLQEGSFSFEGVPEYHRTIGYPLFLSSMLKVAEMITIDWRLITYFTQSVVFAFAYPAIYCIGSVLFGLRSRVCLLCILFIMCSGAFVSYAPILLSDAMFATSLIVGMAFGLLALKNQSILYAFGYICLIVYAANVRPMLSFYPLAALLLQWGLLRRHGAPIPAKPKNLAIWMFVLTLVGVQTPALRNWVNHDVFTPTEIGSINLYNYIAQDVLKHKGELTRYQEVTERLKNMPGPEEIEQRINLRVKEAIQVFFDYPLETLGLMGYFSVLNSIEMHWQNLFYLFKKTWYRDYEDMSVTWSPLPFLFGIIFIFIYGNIYLIFSLSLFFLKRNYLYLFALLLFLAPYAFCGTTYQGSRFRLWFEPIVLLLVFRVLQEAYTHISVQTLASKPQNQKNNQVHPSEQSWTV